MMTQLALMHIFLAVLVFLSFFLSVTSNEFEDMSEDILERLHFVYYKLTAEEMSKCHQNSQACYACVGGCEYPPGSKQQQQHQARLKQASMVREANECHAKYLNLRTGLPDWCFNQGMDFFATRDFVPTTEICGLMNKVSCAEKWMEDLNIGLSLGKVKKRSQEYEIGERALEYANLLEAIDVEKKELEKIPELTRQYSEEKKKNLVNEAITHLRNPSSATTTYSNPVYADMENIKAENQKWDSEISKNDVYMAGIQNMFVRKQTVNKIPNILDAISKLKNQIHSKKDETTRYINDIKAIANQTALFQAKTTNLIYETAHVGHTDGTIAVLDTELLDLYNVLKDQRKLLRITNNDATTAKSQLIDVMRQLVTEISKQQEEMGCFDTDIMFK